MGWNQIAAVASGAIALVGAICTAWQIYQMTVSDAKARGLNQEKIETRKKAAGAALVFMTLGAIGFVISIMRIYI